MEFFSFIHHKDKSKNEININSRKKPLQMMTEREKAKQFTETMQTMRSLLVTQLPLYKNEIQ